jgi:hypothetical protein
MFNFGAWLCALIFTRVRECHLPLEGVWCGAVMALVQICTERELRLRATLNLMGLRVRA